MSFGERKSEIVVSGCMSFFLLFSCRFVCRCSGNILSYRLYLYLNRSYRTDVRSLLIYLRKSRKVHAVVVVLEAAC